MRRKKISGVIIGCVLLVGVAGCSNAKNTDSVKYDGSGAILKSYIEKNEDNVGAIFPNLYSVGDQYAIVASYFGMYVIEMRKERIVDYVDLAKYGCDQFQGDQVVQITTDGNDIYFYNMENESISGKIYRLTISDGILEENAQDEYEQLQTTDTSKTINYDSFVANQEAKLAEKLKVYTDIAKSDVLDMGSYKLFTVAKDWKLSNLKIVLINTETENVKEIAVR